MRAFLLVLCLLLLAATIGLLLFLKLYLPRPEAAAWLSRLLSRSPGIQGHVGRVEVPLGWKGLGPIILHDLTLLGPGIQGHVGRVEVPLGWKGLGAVALHGLTFSRNQPDSSTFQAQSIKLKLHLLPFLRKRELKFQWIEVFRPELIWRGPSFQACEEVRVYLTWAPIGFALLQEQAGRMPVDRFTLQKGFLGMVSFRLTSVALHVEGWGSPESRFQLSGIAALGGAPLPFKSEARLVSAPFRLAARVQVDDAPLTPLQARLPVLDFAASRAAALLVLTSSSEEWMEGTFEMRAKEILLRGSRQSWDPFLQARFRLDLSKGEVTVSRATLRAQGVSAEGRGWVGCRGKGVGYTVQVNSLLANLAELGGKIPKLPLGEGRLFIHTVEARGVWPLEPPTLKIAGSLDGIGSSPPFQGVRLLGLKGRFRIEGGADRLRAWAALGGTARGVPAVEEVGITLTGGAQGDTRHGDFRVEGLELRADPFGKVNLTGSVKGWGKELFELKTNRMDLNRQTLGRLLAQFKEGTVIEALDQPSLRVVFREGLWEAWVAVGTLSLSIPDHSMVLEGGKVQLLGPWIGGKNLEGTMAGRSLVVDGYLLDNPRVVFEARNRRVSLKHLHALTYGAEVKGEGNFVLPLLPQEGQITLDIRHLRLGQLLAGPKAGQILSLPVTLAKDSSLEVSGEAFLKLRGNNLSFRVRTEPIQAQEAMALAQGKVLPVEATGGTVWGEVTGTIEDGKARLDGSVSLEKLGIRLKPWDDIPLTLSLRLPFTYQEGVFRFWGEKVPFDLQRVLPPGSSPPHLPLKLHGGEVLLSWQGQFSSPQGVSLTGLMELKNLQFAWIPKGDSPAVQVQSLAGTVPFAFQEGFLRVPEARLKVGEHVRALAALSLPVSPRGHEPRRLRLSVPSTSAQELQRVFFDLLPGMLLDTKLSGRLEAGLEVVGEKIQGRVRAEDVGISNEVLSIKGLNGILPLVGTLGASSKLRRNGWQAFSEDAYGKALKAFLQHPPSSRPSLTIGSFSYAGLEFRDFAIHLVPREGSLSIQALTFRGLGGRSFGRGTIDLLGGHLHLALLVEGLSLRTICNQFPPIKGYLSGKLNGMVEFSLPAFEPSGAKGRARFWAIASKEEPRKISKELITRLGGKPGKLFSFFWRDRPYDHGLLDVTFVDQSLVFQRLELLHRNFLGKRDLEIKVVPPFNTIAIEDLIGTIQETWERVQGMGG